ncbi:unnamed protein product, partial [Heterotrigona itama]
MHEKFPHTYIPFLPIQLKFTFGTSLTAIHFVSLSLVAVPRAVLKEQYQGDVEMDEVDLMHQFEEGFDRADFRAEFSPSPNLEGPQSQPRDNVSRNFPTVSSSPPRARTNNDERLHIVLRPRKIEESRCSRRRRCSKRDTVSGIRSTIGQRWTAPRSDNC